MSFKVKTIQFYGQRSILSQAENGPCALLAIVNTLLLTTTEHSPQGWHQLVALVNSGEGEVSLEQLLQRLYAIAVDQLQDQNASPEESQAVLNLLPTLNEGLNVDPHFGGGFTPGLEVSIFHVFGVKIVHGWVIDPETPEYASVIKYNSYEQAQSVLVEAYEKSQAGETEGEVIDDSVAIKHFMAHTATQLTPYGLNYLKQSLVEDEICVFFRNNHFNTIIKHDGEVYQLVTDQGFVNKKEYVWESLLSVNGSINSFFTGEFRPLVDGENVEDEDEDRLMAVRMQEEEDERVAAALQRRYEDNGNRQRQQQQAQQQNVRPQASEDEKKSKCCTIM
jgi:hypothetical protein